MPTSFSPDQLRKHIANSDAKTCLEVGVSLQSQGHYSEADMLIGRCIQLLQQKKNSEENNSTNIDQELSNAYFYMGINFNFQHEFDYALKSYQLALTLNPNNAQAHHNLANILLKQGYSDTAILHFEKATQLDPSSLHYRISLASAYGMTKRVDDAIKLTKEVIKQDPSQIDAKINLPLLYFFAGDIENAKRHAQKVIDEHNDLDNESLKGLKINSALYVSPIMESVEMIEEERSIVEQRIDDLLEENFTISPHTFVVRPTYYLSYHGFNNKVILSKLAQFFRKACPELNYIAPHCKNNTPSTGKKLRVGVASCFKHKHPVTQVHSQFFKIFSQLDDFELYIFSTLHKDNDGFANSVDADKFVQISKDVIKAQESIAAYELDIMLYPELGMEIYYLAFARLAPIQCVFGGVPDTSGIDTVDYVISSESLEPENGQEHYIENLIKLKNIPVYYVKPEVNQTLISREKLGLDSHKNYYYCPMLPKKIHPEFDEIIEGILTQDDKAIILLLEPDVIAQQQKLVERLKTKLPSHIKRIQFVPFMHDKNRFYSFLSHVDVFIDSIHFSGGTTNMFAFALGVPIVTLEGKFTRSRGATSQYIAMGISDLTAKDKNDYIKLAVKLANDKKFYQSKKQEILENNHKLYSNKNAVYEVADCLKDLVAKHASKLLNN